MTCYQASFTPLSGSGWFISSLILLCAVAAADGGGPAPFTDEAIQRGIAYLVEAGGGQFGLGVAFVDLDGDLDADVITLGRADGVVGVYQNDGHGFFIDRSGKSGIPPVVLASGVVAGDYDADGDLDLYFSNWEVPDLLMRNEGDFQFTDVTASTGLGGAGKGQGCAWGDYDNDGWLDLYLTNRNALIVKTPPNRLYRNLGDGTFVDVAPALGVDDDQPNFQSVFFDFDHDGDADLYLATDKGSGLCLFFNRFFENTGGAFIDAGDSTGTGVCMDGMGVAVGDFDGNGYQDLYPTNTDDGNPLFLNQGDGTFVDFSEGAGVGSYALGWGAVFFDYDNDGHQDLYVCNMGDPNRLYRHQGTFPAVDIAATVGVDVAGNSFCTAVADVDNDGDLDFLLSNTGEPIRLFINHEGESRRWIKFEVVGQGNNRFAIGANVAVRVQSVWHLREVIAGSNYKSQNELVLHFGLGDALILDEIQVMWPGGATRALANYPTNQTWTLYPTDKLGDADHDGDRDLDDFAGMVGCWSGPAVGSLTPGCEALDFDGDGDADLADFAAFQLACSCGGN